jgi:hypothetical protein
MLSGMALTLVILLRVIWGIWGSEHAKFQNFDLNPLNLKWYFFRTDHKLKRALGWTQCRFKLGYFDYDGFRFKSWCYRILNGYRIKRATRRFSRSFGQYFYL